MNYEDWYLFMEEECYADENGTLFFDFVLYGEKKGEQAKEVFRVKRTMTNDNNVVEGWQEMSLDDKTKMLILSRYQIDDTKNHTVTKMVLPIEKTMPLKKILDGK